MSVTYVIGGTSGGAGTDSNQTSGTAVRSAGKTGRVRAAFRSTLTTTTATLKGATSGKEIIPAGCKPNLVGPITAQDGGVNAFIFDGFVNPGEDLSLDVVRAGTETWAIEIRLD